MVFELIAVAVNINGQISNGIDTRDNHSHSQAQNSVNVSSVTRDSSRHWVTCLYCYYYHHHAVGSSFVKLNFVHLFICRQINYVTH